MRRLVPLGLVCALVAGVLGCGVDRARVPAEAGDPLVRVGDVRFSLPTPHRVVVERRTTDGWGDARIVFEDHGRECGRVQAFAAGSTVAATVRCDEDSYADDQAPTTSVALVSPDAQSWTHRDLVGEAYSTPGVSPDGSHAVWVQDDDLLVWSDGSFRTAPDPTGSAHLVTVDDDGTIVGALARGSAGQCEVEVHTYAAEVTQVAVPVAEASRFWGGCGEVGLSLATPTEIRGDVSGQAGSEFVVRRTGAGGWVLTVRPPVAAPGLSVYSDDAGRAIWNQVTSNSRGDVVAVGSPDRQHITAQRYSRARQRWTRSRVVHDAGARVCNRSNDDSGVVQGATFRLRLWCDGHPIVLLSRAGATWRT